MGIVDQVVTPASPSASVPLITSAPVVFDNARPQFRRMVFRGALLELVTVGFYRFWLGTDIRRHLWRSTSVDGDALEYTGLPKELLFGALLALAIFGPIYLVYFLIGLEAERMKAFASVPFGLFFYLFAQFALFRARRYRMTRTVWRGVRFWMTGSGWNYALRSGVWMLLVIVTLGLALPWRDASLERFKMRNSHYGDLQGRFAGTGWEFFRQGWWLWLIAIALAVLPIVEVKLARTPSPSTAFVVPWIMLVGAPFFYAAFKAIQWRWWVSGIRFGEVSFTSQIRPRELFGLYWKVVGWLLLILVLMIAAITSVLISAAYLDTGAGNLQQKVAAAAQHWPILIALIGSYVLAALMAGAVTRIYLIHDLMARIASSTMVHNIAAAENVAARGAAANAVGEGLADSLDIFGF
jgi:uncharacterized membrane protein YjgN (DUF898 family)